MEPEKASTRMKTKKTRMLIRFKNTFCSKNQQIKTSFFLTSSIARQKYHNNLLPLVRVGLNLVGFARGYDIDGRFDRFHSWKVFFPLLISNLCRKDMKHFVIEKPNGCKWKICFSRLAMRCEQRRPFVWGVMTDSDSRRLTFDTFLPNQFIQGIMQLLYFYKLNYFCHKWNFETLKRFL